MADKPQNSLGAGSVPITLDGEDLVLKPSLNAWQQVSRLNGGLRGALDRVQQLDTDTMVAIIGLGLGYSPAGREMKELPAKVYASGLTDDTGGLAERCITFLRVLMSGGRQPVDQASGVAENPQ